MSNENKSKRDKTNSITHLVKIVAEEVFDENIESFDEKIKDIFNRLVKIEFNIKELKENIDVKTPEYVEQQCEMTSLFAPLGRIENNKENKYKTWYSSEDDLLKQEFEQLILKIAMAHKRSPGAIRSRINKMDLIWG